MTASPTERISVGKFDSAMPALIGHLVAGFVPVLIYAVLAHVWDLEFRSLIFELMSRMFMVFTAATLPTYAIGLVPLWFIARVRKKSHAFWIFAFATGTVALWLIGCGAWLIDLGILGLCLVGLMHMGMLTITCAAYAGAEQLPKSATN